jgi:hypothetical protein
MTAIAAITKEKRCPICQRQFVRSRRSNRFRQSGRPNEEHIYCSSGCRQKAYRRRVRADRAAIRRAPSRINDGWDRWLEINYRRRGFRQE